MRPSRHAKNKARLLKIPWIEIQDALVEEIACHGPAGLDRYGNFEYEFQVLGCEMHAVIAADDPERVITLWQRKR